MCVCVCVCEKYFKTNVFLFKTDRDNMYQVFALKLGWFLCGALVLMLVAYCLSMADVKMREP